MNQKGNDPLWQEFRSSQVYKTLKDVGVPLAGKLAEGLGKAAQELDQAVNTPKKNRPNGPYQPSPGPQNGTPQPGASWPNGGQAGAPQPGASWANSGQAGAPQPGASRPNGGQTGAPQPGASRPNGGQTGAPQPNGGQANGYYHYSYTQGQPAGQAGSQQVRPPQAPPFRAGKAQRQAAANRAAAAQHAAQQQAQAAWQAAKASHQSVPTGQGPMKLVHTGSPAKYYITGVVALLYALMGPMYQAQHFAFFAVVVALVFLVSGALFRGKKVFVPVEPEKPEEAPEKGAGEGGEIPHRQPRGGQDHRRGPGVPEEAPGGG